MLGALLVAQPFHTAIRLREWQYPDPLIDLQLFRSSAFSGGLVAVNLSYALLYSMFFLMSFLFIHGLNESPISAGLHLALIPIALGLVAPFSGGIYARIGARTMTTLAMLVCVAALALLSRSLSGQSVNDSTSWARSRYSVPGWACSSRQTTALRSAAAPDELTPARQAACSISCASWVAPLESQPRRLRFHGVSLC
jgi:hypothetical protein